MKQGVKVLLFLVRLVTNIEVYMKILATYNRMNKTWYIMQFDGVTCRVLERIESESSGQVFLKYPNAVIN